MKWEAKKVEEQMWHLGMGFSGGLGSAGLMLGLVILKVFSNLNNLSFQTIFQKLSKT